MADLSLVISAVKGQFDDVMAAKLQVIAKAGTAAIHDVGTEALDRGRAAIASAGFSSRWTNTLRCDFYPTGNRPSLKAVAHIYHRIPYAGIFEHGGPIRGKPYLWLPLPGLPQRLGGHRMTPAQFNAQIGPLTYVPHPGKPPTLDAPMLGTRASRASVGALRTGAGLSKLGVSRETSGRGRSLIMVPVFVGVPVVNLRARFNVDQIIETAQKGLGGAFQRHLGDS